MFRSGRPEEPNAPRKENRSKSEFNGFEATFVDRLELHTEEHRGDVREDEGFILLHKDTLNVTHLVIANKHV